MGREKKTLIPTYSKTTQLLFIVTFYLCSRLHSSRVYSKVDVSHLPPVSNVNQEQIFLLCRQIKESCCAPAFMEMGEMSFLVSSKLITNFWGYYCNLFGESQKASQPYYRYFTLLWAQTV